MSEDTTHEINAQEKHATKDYQDLHALMQNVQDLTNEIKARRGMTEHFRRKSWKLQKVIDNYEAGEETRRQSASRQEEKINTLQELLASTSQKLYTLGYAVRTLTTLEVAKSGALLEHAGISEEDLLNARKYAEGAPVPLRSPSLPRDRVLVESSAMKQYPEAEDLRQAFESGEWIHTLVNRMGYAFKGEDEMDNFARRASIEFQEMWNMYQNPTYCEEAQRSAQEKDTKQT